MKVFVTWNPDLSISESSGNKQGIMCTLLESNQDFILGNLYKCGGINEITEDMARFGILIPIANHSTQQPIQAAGHKCQLKIAKE